MIKIEYLTSNKIKFEEARLILKEWELEQVDVELHEIQGDRHAVIKAKAKEAVAILQKPLIVEDVSFCCKAIGGLPGPYIKDFLKKIGDTGLAQLIHKYDDHQAIAICVAAFIEPNQDAIIFEGSVEGTIVYPRGHHMHGSLSWNRIFQPTGYSLTYGEITLEEQSKLSMRKIALTKLRKYLEKRKIEA